MLSTCSSSSISSNCTQAARVVAVTIMPIMPRRQRRRQQWRRQRQRQAAIAGTLTHASPKDNFLSMLLLPCSVLLLSSSASSPLQVSLLRRNQRLSIYVAIFSLPSTRRHCCRRRLEAAVCKVAGCWCCNCHFMHAWAEHKWMQNGLNAARWHL